MKEEVSARDEIGCAPITDSPGEVVELTVRRLPKAAKARSGLLEGKRS
jgi:hypothetical protein